MDGKAKIEKGRGDQGPSFLLLRTVTLCFEQNVNP